MCGIVGILDDHSRLQPISSMNQAQSHRGPDDEGYIFINTTNKKWQSAGGPDTPAELGLLSHAAVNVGLFDLVLGSRRLAILDLSPAGHMPMTYQAGMLWIVHNGEVYNYRELRSELEILGHTFVSDSDTEVILAAYVEWGADCVSHFNGMFAFALWDAQRQRLFCARDRFGVKPFYYYWNGSSFFFASEIKALLQHSSVPCQPNDQSVYDYLALGVTDHSEQTFFQDICALPPSHFLLLDTSTRHLKIQRWWQCSINPAIEDASQKNQQEVYNEFAHLLEDAVRLRLRSDVPIGSCLSGGLDSSAVVCLINRLLVNEQVIPHDLVGEHLKTFTARNFESEIDEYQYSHLVVEQTGAEENIVFPSGEKLWQEISSFVWHMDEPVDSTSQYLQWNVMRLAKQRGVTVLLDGQGGDEILAGYYAYYPAYLSQIRQQQGLLSGLRAAWDISSVGGPPVRDILWKNATQRLPWRLQPLATALRPLRSVPGGGGSGLQGWQLSPEFLQRFAERSWQPATSVDHNGLVGVLYRDLTATNLPKLLRYEDRNSMAFSLETRLPFLDYRLVEMVFALPLQYRIQNGWSKWILRRSLQDILPKEINWRRSKLGFPVPERSWLQEGGNFIQQLLKSHREDSAVDTYLRPGLLRQLSELPPPVLAETPGIWRIVNFILWYELFISMERQGSSQSEQQIEMIR